MHSRASWIRVAPAALLIAGVLLGCPAPPPPRATAPPPRAPAGASALLELDTDPRVDRVDLVGELPGAALRRTAPGRFRLELTGLEPGRWYRYRYRVHRPDLGRAVEVSDPRAGVLDASSRRWSLLRAGVPLPPPPAPLRPPAVRDLIIYELNPREWVPPGTPFAHPAHEPAARGPGQVFREITRRIREGYFQRLGVNALELMPLTASAWVTWKRERPERDPWGYSAISWYALNGDYGAPEDLVELVRAAHEAGLIVLLDYSLDHGAGRADQGLITDLHPAWRVPNPRNPWGLLELDLGRGDVREFLVGALRRFLVDYGVDGFRMDWTENVPAETWAYFVREVRRIRPDALLISENPVRALVAEAGFATTWDFFFHWEAPLLLRGVFENWDGINGRRVSTQDKLVENLTDWARGPHSPPAPLIRYLESHDMPRVARPRVRWQAGGDQLLDVDGDGKTPDWLDGGSVARSRLGAVLLATVPGAVMLYAGQEHGASDDLVWAHDPLDFAAADAETLAHYQKVLGLRRQHPVLRGDDLRVLLNDAARHVLAYSRGTDPSRADDDTAVVVLNFGPQPVRGVRFKLTAAGCWRDALTGRALPPGLPQVLDLPRDGAVLLLCASREGRCAPRTIACEMPRVPATRAGPSSHGRSR